ncbi:MAG: hypothetical protein R6X02_15840 [Enhygromyxa sp.]
MTTEPDHPPVRDWWPVDLDDDLLDALACFVDELAEAEVVLDRAVNADADARLLHAMHGQIHDVIDGAALSHYCHLINGWGDATIAGGRLTDGLEFFARSGPRGPYLRQFHRDGDFHPWQTLAYAIMAGVELERELPSLGVSLAELYATSTAIPTTEGEELGHLLFALAHFDSPAQLELALDGRVRSLDELMQLAIAAHHDGHFRVCCKTHLCEGICAAAARIPQLAGYRAQAQAFLDGQLDLMLLLTLAARERAAAQLDGRQLDANSMSARIIRALARTDNFEDHVFFAGHQIELAILAHGFGYELPQVYRRALTMLANVSNSMLSQYLDRSSFSEHFLFYGHYRRAITLLPAMLDAEAAGRKWTLDPATLAGFTVDFDRPCAAPPAVEVRGPDAWTIAPASEVRPVFGQLLEATRARLPAGFELRGNRAHYRHVKPPHWPKSLHYELLDLGERYACFGLELHVEDDAVAGLIPALAAQREVFCELHVATRVRWEPRWGNGARLRALVPEDTPPAETAELLHRLIERSYPAVDAALTDLRESAGPLGLTQPAVFAGESVAQQGA